MAKPLTITEYTETSSWPDYIESQISPFGAIPVFFSGIGNHETVPP